MNSRILIAIAATLLLSACANHTVDHKRYFLASDIPSSNFYNDKIKVNLLDILDNGGIVLAVNDVELYTAKSNRWAVNLGQQLKSIFSYKIKDIAYFKHKDVELFFSAFNGVKDGGAKVAFSVKIFDEKHKLVKSQDLENISAVQDDGYDALVNELKANYIHLIDQFIKGIK